MVKIFAKSILEEDQIKARKGLNIDGIEVYLTKPDLEGSRPKDMIKLCSDSFRVVNLETGDRLYGIRPTDLLDDESRRYVESVLGIHAKMPNAGFVNMHLAGGCQVLRPPYKGLTKEKKKGTLMACLDYINTLDPGNQTIVLENSFPTDWMYGAEGIISFHPIGKISADFEKRIRTFDIAHSGITAFTYANLADFRGNYGFFESAEFGKIPVYFSDEERKVAESARESITRAVCEEIEGANIVNVHVNTNKGLLDGFGIGDKCDINLELVLSKLLASKRDQLNLVAEVKEEDYLSIPKQRAMISYLRSRVALLEST